MHSFFLENVVRLLILLVAVQFALVAIWSWWRGRRAAQAVWVGAALFPALVVLNTLFVTPSERIIRICHSLAKLVDDGDVTGISRILAEDFRAGRADRSRFLDRLRSRLTEYRVDDPRLRGFNVTFSQSDHGVAVFDALCRVRSADFFFDRLPSRWRLIFRNRAGRWLVTGIEVLRTSSSPIPDLQGLTR